MEFILQIWGAGFYLLNKLLFAIAEKKQEKIKKALKMGAWISYIIGVPAWLIILAGESNWIATSVEAGGVPAMMLGLYNTYHNNNKNNQYLNNLVSFSTYLALILGVGYSLIVHSGINSISQILEMGVMLGFLLGSYFMAKNDAKGWLYFMLMNISMISLMFLQNKPILMVQQLLSLCLVIYGYYAANKNKNIFRK